MKYLALAADYDGTLAFNGQVSDETVEALALLKDSGRKLILVTGRQLDDLLLVFPNAVLFDRMVTENGAVLYTPTTGERKALVAPPPEAFVKVLRAKKVKPLFVGRVVVATLLPYEREVREVVRDLGLDLRVILNKDSVMVLPAGVDKGSGLHVALRDLGLSALNIVAVGDAENDHPLLAAARCGVAVAGALPMLKEAAGWVTPSDNGAGVRELIAALIEDDLEQVDRRRAVGSAPRRADGSGADHAPGDS